MMSFMQLATVFEMDQGLQNANAYTIRGQYTAGIVQTH